eukprot:14548143-Alexandrium_andersonii.AAC.1
MPSFARTGPTQAAVGIGALRARARPRLRPRLPRRTPRGDPRPCSTRSGPNRSRAVLGSVGSVSVAVGSVDRF